MTNHVFTQAQLTRTARILYDTFECKDDITETLDKHVDYSALRNVGKVRKHIVAYIMGLSDESFEALVGLPIHCAPVEGTLEAV